LTTSAGVTVNKYRSNSVDVGPEKESVCHQVGVRPKVWRDVGSLEIFANLATRNCTRALVGMEERIAELWLPSTNCDLANGSLSQVLTEQGSPSTRT
jgi:hypothetical protein